MSLIPLVVIWAILAAVVIALALFRNLTAMHEDDMLHLGAGEEKMIPKQIRLFRKLEAVDRWGKALTVITVAGGIVLAAVILMRAWNAQP